MKKKPYPNSASVITDKNVNENFCTKILQKGDLKNYEGSRKSGIIWLYMYLLSLLSWKTDGDYRIPEYAFALINKHVPVYSLITRHLSKFKGKMELRKFEEIYEYLYL